MNPAWLNITKAASYASVHRGTISKWLDEGLKHSRIGKLVLIKPESIDEFINNYERSAAVDLSGLLKRGRK